MKTEQHTQGSKTRIDQVQDSLKRLASKHEPLYLTLISLRPKESKHRDPTISLLNRLKDHNISPQLEGSREDTGTYVISLRLNLNDIKSVLSLPALIELGENSFTIRTYTPKFSKVIIRGLTNQILEDEEGIDELTSNFDESKPIVKARPDHHAEIGGKTNTLVLLYHKTPELLKENPRITIKEQYLNVVITKGPRFPPTNGRTWAERLQNNNRTKSPKTTIAEPLPPMQYTSKLKKDENQPKNTTKANSAPLFSFLRRDNSTQQTLRSIYNWKSIDTTPNLKKRKKATL
jgi:hypothetical protein